MKKLTLLLMTIGSSYWTSAQVCGTPQPANPIIYPSTISAREANSSFCIDVFFHIVRNTDRTDAFPRPNTDAIVNELNEFYRPHDIIINNAGTGFINNSDNLYVDGNEGYSIANSYNKDNAINYYIVQDMLYYGFAWCSL